MCIIVYNRDGKELCKESMRTAYDNNPHGYGIMWYDGDRVLSLKEHDGGFQRLWETVERFKGVPYALHLRWRTRGAQGLKQCHPHVVTSKDNGAPEDVYLMHNGTLSGFQDHAKLSDTNMFARKMRALMQIKGLDFSSALDNMERHIEASFTNRLLFMDSRGEITLVNESAGEWIDGVWYSNVYSFQPGFRDPKPRKKKPQQATLFREDYWNDSRPTMVLRGTATSKKRKKKRKTKTQQKKNRNSNKTQSAAERLNLPPGRHVDSRGNVFMVTNSGAVLRVR